MGGHGGAPARGAADGGERLGRLRGGQPDGDPGVGPEGGGRGRRGRGRRARAQGDRRRARGDRARRRGDRADG